ncbi:hypothetical protein BB561_005223 [Smittium simulii]|uniref:BRCT domain-containing protein n=1 Tax=Smittium simulii TaxID=133385 RepID=A0A2T9YBL9_9FUNG|nr:hypothetical protein BB561_005223 [Smittium simulii]
MSNLDLFSGKTAWFSDNSPTAYRDLWRKYGGKLASGLNDPSSTHYFYTNELDQVTFTMIKYKAQTPLKVSWVVDCVYQNKIIDDSGYYFNDSTPQDKASQKFASKDIVLPNSPNNRFKHRYSESYLQNKTPAAANSQPSPKAALSTGSLVPNPRLFKNNFSSSLENSNKLSDRLSYRTTPFYQPINSPNSNVRHYTNSKSFAYSGNVFVDLSLQNNVLSSNNHLQTKLDYQYHNSVNKFYPIEKTTNFENIYRSPSRMTSKSSRISKAHLTRKIIKTDSTTRQLILKDVRDFTPNKNGFLVYQLN